MGEGAQRGWQAWLLPQRPGLKPFILGAGSLLLPIPAILLGEDLIIPAMVASASLGGGLGLGWAVLYARSWLTSAPFRGFAVFAVTAACLGQLTVMPSWDLLLRAQKVRDDFLAYTQGIRSGRRLTPPLYRNGPVVHTLRVELPPVHASAPAVAWTPEPLQRWTPFGYRDAWYLLLRADNQVLTAAVTERFTDQTELESAIAELTRR